MDIKTEKSLNIQPKQKQNVCNVKKTESDAKFSKELEAINKSSKNEDVKKSEINNPDTKDGIRADLNSDIDNNEELPVNKNNTENNDNATIDGTREDVIVGTAIEGLTGIFDELSKLGQKDDIESNNLKTCTVPAVEKNIDENKNEDLGLIDNNMNVQEPKDKINLQMTGNMDFNSNGQPFTEFIKENKSKDVLKSSAKELAEEKAILSTMEENIAIANKNMAISKTKTVENEHGIQKVNKKSDIVVDTVVSYDKIIMDKSDAEFFSNLVNEGVINMSEIQNAEKSAKVSKTLADMLQKAMNENKPIRIDFDNNISIIIKIDRAGKISADFLPSSQVAETYLKENLPLLKQRFDDNNIDYKELNQRQRKQDTEDNRKKGRKDE